MVSAALITSFLLLFFASETAAIGPCNHDLIQKMMDINNANCAHHFLETVYNASSLIRIAVVNQKYADKYSCITTVGDEPVANVGVVHNKYTYKDTCRGNFYVNFTIVEAKCGLLYKYIAEEEYKSFTIVMGWTDGMTIGLWGCAHETDDPMYDENENYNFCLTISTEDTEEVTASLTKCRDYMANLTGATDLVIMPYCNDHNEYQRDHHD